MFNTKNDVELTPGPSDGASSLAFSPVADYLAASSWDGQTRIWEVAPNGSSMAKAAISHEGPSLSCAWSADGTKCFSGGADKTVKMIDLAAGGQTMSFAAHDQAVKSMRWVSTANFQALVTGSWDKTLKYWDLRSPQPMATVQLPERCYSMDSVGDLLVVGTAERHILVFNLANPASPFKTIQSPLKWQTRTVSCFQNGTGFAVGSIEGRVGLQYINPTKPEDNFAFKCHRDDKLVFPVNAISFHPTFGTFSTSGADGYIHTWDKDSRQRLESSVALGAPIQATTFNRNGSLYAYSLGYDWFKGHEFYEANSKNAIMIHAVAENEFKPRQSAVFRRR